MEIKNNLTLRQLFSQFQALFPHELYPYVRAYHTYQDDPEDLADVLRSNEEAEHQGQGQLRSRSSSGSPSSNFHQGQVLRPDMQPGRQQKRQSYFDNYIVEN